MILALAKEYGQAPQEVENWDAFWLHRAWTLMRAESIDADRRMNE